MNNTKTITGLDEESIWNQINLDFVNQPNLTEYHAVLEQNERRIILDIDDNPAYTTFSAYLYNRNDFRFAIHPQGFIDEIGKFFGMQDIVLGFKEFDERYIIKTNEEGRTETLFADANIRKLFEAIPGLSFGIVQYTLENADGKVPFLELRIEGCINEPILLRKIYSAFYAILLLIEA